MKAKTTAVLLLVLAALAPAGARAQEQRPAFCPTILVSCPDREAEKTLGFPVTNR